MPAGQHVWASPQGVTVVVAPSGNVDNSEIEIDLGEPGRYCVKQISQDAPGTAGTSTAHGPSLTKESAATSATKKIVTVTSVGIATPISEVLDPPLEFHTTDGLIYFKPGYDGSGTSLRAVIEIGTLGGQKIAEP